MLFAAAGTAAFWQSSRATVLWDVTYVLEIAHRIRLGDVPYRDVVIPQPPLTFLLQAVLLGAPGGGYGWQRAYCAVGAGLVVVLCYRIVLALMAPLFGPRAANYAFAIVLPCVFLNGYAILPLPFYDSDCALLALAGLAAILAARRSSSLWRHALAGAIVVLPPMAKQNMGIAFTLAVHALAIASAAGRRGDRTEWRNYAAFLAGSVAAIALIASAIEAWIGMSRYYEWTVAYAASRRWPSPGLMLAPYARLDTWVAVACVAAGYLTFRSGAATGWRVTLSWSIALAPFAYAGRTMLRWGLSARSHYLWGLGTLVGGPVALAHCIAERFRFESAVPLAALAVAHAAFASQGVYDSAYSVWPFLAIAIVPLVGWAGSPPSGARGAAAIVLIVSVGGSLLGVLHLARQERLGFVDLSGGVQIANLPAIRGLAVPGVHVVDFERMVERTNALIPRSSAVLSFPGEDPFFLASNRRPHLPIVLFDDTAMPYDASGLLQLLDERAIEWVVVKERLQLRHQPWRHMETFLTDYLPRRFAPVESLPGYVIFRRRAPAPAIADADRRLRDADRTEHADQKPRGAHSVIRVGHAR